MEFYVYLLLCSDGFLYAGHTDNLEARLVAHRTGAFGGYTKSRRPVRLIWCDSFPSRDDAFQRERQIKGWSRAKKLALARGDWEKLVALSRSRGSTGSP